MSKPWGNSQVSPLIAREPIVNAAGKVIGSRITLERFDPTSTAEALTLLPFERPVIINCSEPFTAPGICTLPMPAHACLEIPADSLHTIECHCAPPIALRGSSAATFKDYTVPFHLIRADATPPETSAGAVIAHDVRDLSHFLALMQDDRFDGACGMFFLDPSLTVPPLHPSMAVLIDLVDMIGQEAPSNQIEAKLRQDPAVSYKLLRYINSAASGLRKPVTSFRHAVTILGYQALRNWLIVLLLTSNDQNRFQALLQVALFRGHVLETLGRNRVTDANSLFMTGAFSVLDLIIGEGLDAALDKINPPASVTQAITNGEGPHAPLLAIAKAMESHDFATLRQCLFELNIDETESNHALLEALRFADSILQQSAPGDS